MKRCSDCRISPETLHDLTLIVLNTDDFLFSYEKDFDADARRAADSLYEEARRLDVMPHEPERS